MTGKDTIKKEDKSTPEMEESKQIARDKSVAEEAAHLRDYKSEEGLAEARAHLPLVAFHRDRDSCFDCSSPTVKSLRPQMLAKIEETSP